MSEDEKRCKKASAVPEMLQLSVTGTGSTKRIAGLPLKLKDPQLLGGPIPRPASWKRIEHVNDDKLQQA
jgi:hypothetical protein